MHFIPSFTCNLMSSSQDEQLTTNNGVDFSHYSPSAHRAIIRLDACSTKQEAQLRRRTDAIGVSSAMAKGAEVAILTLVNKM